MKRCPYCNGLGGHIYSCAHPEISLADSQAAGASISRAPANLTSIGYHTRLVAFRAKTVFAWLSILFGIAGIQSGMHGCQATGKDGAAGLMGLVFFVFGSVLATVGVSWMITTRHDRQALKNR